MDISKPCMSIIPVMIILGIWCLHEHREIGLFMFPVYMINTSNLAFRCLFSSKLFSICISLSWHKDETPLQKWDAAITVNWLTATSWWLTFLFFEKNVLMSMLSGGENISTKRSSALIFAVLTISWTFGVCALPPLPASLHTTDLSCPTMTTLLEHARAMWESALVQSSSENMVRSFIDLGILSISKWNGFHLIVKHWHSALQSAASG